MVTITREDPREADAVRLLAASDALMAELYPSESNHMLDVAALAQPEVSFFVARLEGVALGCGAWVRTGACEAEVKRMFVAPDARGRRVGRMLLEHIEQDAAATGVRIIRLETGVRQPEALALYHGRGYAERGPFGPYTEDPLSLFMEKRLSSPASNH